MNNNDDDNKEVTCIYCGNDWEGLAVCRMCQAHICDQCQKNVYPEEPSEYVHVDSRKSYFLCQKCGIKHAQFYVPIL